MNLIDLDALLSEAVRHEDALVVQYLLRQGARVSADDDMLLPVAVQAGNVEKVKYLMDFCGTDFALKAKRLALQLAVFLDRPRIIRVLLEAGIDPEYVVSKASQKTLLHECVLGNMSLESIQLLIQHGGNVNRQDDDGRTPLHSIAVKRGQHEKAQCLIRAGALPNTPCNDGRTPLHYACEEGLLETARALTGANPNVQCLAGYTPLHAAIAGNSPAVVTWLIQDAGAKIHHGYAETPFFHASPLSTAESSSTGMTMMPSALIRLGISPWETDVQGNTALHYCCQRHSEDAEAQGDDYGGGGEHRSAFLDELVHYAPALILAKNHQGATPLHLACKWSAQLAGRLVRRHGADLSISDRFGRTPLVIAIMDGNTAVVQELLDLIAQREDDGMALLEQTNHDGWTALHWAALLRRSGAVESLLHAGARVNVKNRSGRTPLSLVGFPLDSNQALYSIDDSDVTRIVNTRFPVLRHTMDTHDTRREDAATVRQLLDRGADVTELDDHGNLSFFLAAATARVSETFFMMQAAASQGLVEMMSSGSLRDQWATRTEQA